MQRSQRPITPYTPGRARRIAGAVLIYFVALVLFAAGSSKLAHLAPVVAEMTSLNLIGWKLNAVGCLEISTAILFALPQLRSLGLLVISAYLGGATCAHFVTDQYQAIGPALFLIGCCWIGAALRHPQILWSLNPKPSAVPSSA